MEAFLLEADTTNRAARRNFIPFRIAARQLHCPLSPINPALRRNGFAAPNTPYKNSEHMYEKEMPQYLEYCCQPKFFKHLFFSK